MNYGINYNIPFSAYLRQDAISSSSLGLMKKSGMHLKCPRRDKDTDAQRFGSAVHCNVLEPSEFLKRFIKCEIRRDVRTEAYRDFLAEHGGKETFTAKDWEDVNNLSDAIRAQPSVAKLLNGAKTEVSLLWHDHEAGIDCKARLDGWNEELQTIFDIKTTQDAGYDSFSTTLSKHDYYRQAAYYFHGARQCGLKPLHFCFIAAEKEAPYGVAVYRLDEDDLRLGLLEAKSLLRKYAHCKLNDSWPGYPVEIQPIGLSDFNKSKLEGMYAGS